MGEVSLNPCEGCKLAEGLSARIDDELEGVQKLRGVLLSTEQQDGRREYFANRPPDSAPLAPESDDPYANAGEILDSSVEAVMVWCNIHQARVEDIQRRLRDIMLICPKIVAEIIEEPEPARAPNCASVGQVETLGRELADIRYQE